MYTSDVKCVNDGALSKVDCTIQNTVYHVNVTAFSIMHTLHTP